MLNDPNNELILLNYDSKVLWLMLNDPNNELCLSNYANVPEIVGTLVQFFSGPNFELTFFSKCLFVVTCFSRT